MYAGTLAQDMQERAERSNDRLCALGAEAHTVQCPPKIKAGDSTGAVQGISPMSTCADESCIPRSWKRESEEERKIYFFHSKREIETSPTAARLFSCCGIKMHNVGAGKSQHRQIPSSACSSCAPLGLVTAWARHERSSLVHSEKGLPRFCFQPSSTRTNVCLTFQGYVEMGKKEHTLFVFLAPSQVS